MAGRSSAADAGRLVITDKDDGLGIEDLPDAVTDNIIDRLNIQVLCEAGLHAVDDGKFRIALLCDLEQALGFVKQTGIFECHTHAVGKRLKQAHI